MDRRLIAGLLGLLVSGCAISRSGMPIKGQYAPVGEVDALPPIKTTINDTGDPSARRAGLLPDSPSPDSLPNINAGRPSPFANKTAGSPRIQAPPASGRPEDQPPQPRPSPYKNQAPAGPRPLAPGSAPMLPVVTPAPGSASPPVNEAALPPPGVPPLGDPPAVDHGPSVDDQVKPTSASASAPSPSPAPDPGAPRPGEVPIPTATSAKAATVGKEVITTQQVLHAMYERKDKIPPEEFARPEVKQMLFANILDGLVERTLLVQAAKKKISDAKAIQSIYDSIDKNWIDHELPTLLRTYQVANIYELKAKFTAQHRSLEQIRDDYRQHALASDFLYATIHNKVTASLPEKLAYYNLHRKEFDRPAGVTWREVEVDFAKCAGRDDARRRAEAVLARIKKGEDFAAIARAESHGPTAREGGLWETGFNGSTIQDINEALNNLGPGQVSGAIEVPGGFHVVKVESKRDAGPARFDEVQDEIKKKVVEEKYEKLSKELISSLRAKTIITTIFDENANDPAAVRTNGARPARP